MVEGVGEWECERGLGRKGGVLLDFHFKCIKETTKSKCSLSALDPILNNVT